MTKRTIRQFGLIRTIISLLTIFAPPVFADVTWSGNLDPTDPTTWTDTTYAYIGKTANGTMDIDGGSEVIDNRGYIGDAIGTTGEVTVDGHGSTWTNNSYLYAGDYGNAILDITNGGTVSNTIAFVAYRYDSIADVTVDGLNSQWNNSTLYVGSTGNGTLEIKNGGKVVCTGAGNIAYNSGSISKVTVKGVNSSWSHTSSSSGTYIGNSGNGTLDISDSGTVTARDAWIGRYAGSTGKVTVTDPGSAWNVNVPGGQGQVSVGMQGNGTLEITNGGTVNNKYGYIGTNPGSTGKVTVSGSGSAWTCSSSFRIGYYGNGTMIIKNGAVVTNEGECYIGSETNSAGDVLVVDPGSTWACNDPLVVGRYGPGTLMILNGGLVSVDNNLTIDTNGNGDGFVYVGSGGQLALDRNGSAFSTDIAAFLSMINGTAALKYWNGDNWYGILDATADVDYTLTNLTTGDLAGYTLLTVHAPGPPDPDVDADGAVDMEDFAGVASQWLAVNCFEPGWCRRADIDYSGDVGLSDLQILTSYWFDGVE